MVRHNHAVIANLFINPHRSNHVHVPVVRKSFLEAEEPTFDVAEVNIEDLAPAAKVANDVVNIFAGVLEHFGHSSLTKVQSMVLARNDFDEAFKTVNAAEHPVDATKTLTARHG